LRLSDLEPRFICGACGKRGADVRPDWQSVKLMPLGQKNLKRDASTVTADASAGSACREDATTKRRLADEYDAAVERKEIASQGRKKIPAGHRLAYSGHSGPGASRPRGGCAFEPQGCAMEKLRIRALRQARLYGHLINRTGRLYYPGGSHPVCRVKTAHEMVRAGWLVHRDGRYEITPVGLRVLELAPTR
jgi:hypothetical protein